MYNKSQKYHLNLTLDTTDDEVPNFKRLKNTRKHLTHLLV